MSRLVVVVQWELPKKKFFKFLLEFIKLYKQNPLKGFIVKFLFSLSTKTSLWLVDSAFKILGRDLNL